MRDLPEEQQGLPRPLFGRSASQEFVDCMQRTVKDSIGTTGHPHADIHRVHSLFEATWNAVLQLQSDTPCFWISDLVSFSVCPESGAITGSVLDRIGRRRTVGLPLPNILYTMEEFEQIVKDMVRAYRPQSARRSQPNIMENMKLVVLPFLESVLHPSNRHWLQELHSEKKRRYNPNGFHVIEVLKVATGNIQTDFSLRLHLYEPALTQTESVHVHKWHLESLVLAGRFRHLLYDTPGIEEVTYERTFEKFQQKKEGLRKNFGELRGEVKTELPKSVAATPAASLLVPATSSAEALCQQSQDYWLTPELQSAALNSQICAEKPHDAKKFPRYMAGIPFLTQRLSFQETSFIPLNGGEAVDLVKFCDREEKAGNYYFLDAKIPHRVVCTDDAPVTLVITSPVDGINRKDGWKYKLPYDFEKGETMHDYDKKSEEEKREIIGRIHAQMDAEENESKEVASAMSLEEFEGRLWNLVAKMRMNFPSRH